LIDSLIAICMWIVAPAPAACVRMSVYCAGLIIQIVIRYYYYYAGGRDCTGGRCMTTVARARVCV